MHDIQSIEEAVKALTPEQLTEFRQWFVDYDFIKWDDQIELDTASGKLEALLAEAAAEEGDIPLAAFASPRLTTVHSDPAGQGRQAMRGLLALMGGKGPSPVLSEELPAKLVIRASCGAPPPG